MAASFGFVGGEFCEFPVRVTKSASEGTASGTDYDKLNSQRRSRAPNIDTKGEVRSEFIDGNRRFRPLLDNGEKNRFCYQAFCIGSTVCMCSKVRSYMSIFLEFYN